MTDQQTSRTNITDLIISDALHAAKKAVNAYEPLVQALEEVLDMWTAPSDEAYRRIHKVLTGSESCGHDRLDRR